MYIVNPHRSQEKNDRDKRVQLCTKVTCVMFTQTKIFA